MRIDLRSTTTTDLGGHLDRTTVALTLVALILITVLALLQQG